MHMVWGWRSQNYGYDAGHMCRMGYKEAVGLLCESSVWCEDGMSPWRLRFWACTQWGYKESIRLSIWILWSCSLAIIFRCNYAQSNMQRVQFFATTILCHCSFFVCLLLSPIIKCFDFHVEESCDFHVWRKAVIPYLHYYYLGKSVLAGNWKEVINRVINYFHAQKELDPLPEGLGRKKNLFLEWKKGFSLFRAAGFEPAT